VGREKREGSEIGDRLRAVVPTVRSEVELLELERPVEDEDGEPCYLPSLTEDQVPIWKECLASQMRPKMLRALRLVLAGYSFQESAAIVGYACATTLFREAARRGVAGASNRIMALQRANTQAALERLGETVMTEKVRAKDLAIVAGIGHDKINRYDERQQRGEQIVTFANMLHDLVRSIGGATLELKVTPRPDPLQIDVTPESVLVVDQEPEGSS